MSISHCYVVCQYTKLIGRFFSVPLDTENCMWYHDYRHMSMRHRGDLVAQQVEHLTFNQGVAGPNPARVTRV